jgi:hypothetical protein
MRVVPLAGLEPRGPTDLPAALAEVTRLPAAVHRQVIILTDGEVELPDPEALSRGLGQVPVNCVLLSDGAGRKSLERLCNASGGHLAMEANVMNWSQAAGTLAARVAPERWQTSQRMVEMMPPLSPETMQVKGWNQAYARGDAKVIARSGEAAMGGMWRAGLGQVVTLAFDPGEAQVAALAGRLGGRPAAGGEVEWEDGAVVVRPGTESVAVRLVEDGTTRDLPLVAAGPGSLRAEMPEMERPTVVLVLMGGQVVGRKTVAGGYAPEFRSIGLNRPNLDELARRTGGRVIEADDRRPIAIAGQLRLVDLARWAGGLGLACATLGLLLLRRRLGST